MTIKHILFWPLLIFAVLYILANRCRRNHPGLEKLRGWKYAHRGLHGEGRPENSMAAFRAALDHGYGIEFDLHLLRDGNLAVMHDSLLKRTTGREGRIEDLTTADLKNYPLEGTDETIPTFRELLDLYAGKAPLIVELKPVDGNHAALCEATCAMLDTYPRHLPLETNTTVLLELEGGVTGQLWASQIAIGKICSPEIYVVGTEGALEWRHEQPDVLRYTPIKGPTQLWEAGKDYMTPESNRLARVSAGHHEGFFEAFGNIYRGFCQTLLAKKEGRAPESYTFPTIEDGLEGMKFVAACVASHRAGNVWVEL